MNRKAHNTIDRTGQVINNWTIISYIKTVGKVRHYLCRCVCGKEKVASVKNIVIGVSKSCGCQNIENHKKHGMAKERVYNIWQNMKNRCLNPKSTQWVYYGGRGVIICSEWHEFNNFFADMGHPPTNKHTIDRINNSGNYESGNCRWATMKEQCGNRRQPLPKPPTP